MADTLLVLSGMGVPDWSARGLEQTLAPIAASVSMRRRVSDGALIDLSASYLRKYGSTIICRDLRSPALEGIFPGAVVTVDCVAELAYETMTGSPARPVVAGSERVEGGFTFYRPQLIMRVAGWRLTVDEWGARVGWELDLEEV
ncbi:MAG: hypothetical protein VW338_04735 [Rhodospirillaceae bacterium]